MNKPRLKNNFADNYLYIYIFFVWVRRVLRIIESWLMIRFHFLSNIKREERIGSLHSNKGYVQGEPINRVARHTESQNMSHNLFWNRSEIETKEPIFFLFVKVVMEWLSSHKQKNKFSMEWTSSTVSKKLICFETDLNRIPKKNLWRINLHH